MLAISKRRIPLKTLSHVVKPLTLVTPSTSLNILHSIPTSSQQREKFQSPTTTCVTSSFETRRFFSTSKVCKDTIETARDELDEDELETLNDPRAVDTVDVCIVGGGPAGLATAIRLKQIDNEKGDGELRVVLLEKAASMGSHILSGAVLDPIAINELFADELGEGKIALPDELVTLVKEDHMKYLFENGSEVSLPEPPQMKNAGKNYIVSLSEVVKWMSEKAEELGVEIYPNTAVSELIFDSQGGVRGIATRDMGLERDGSISDDFERGMEFHARMTVLAEGCHGSLSKQVINKYDLRNGVNPQTYGLGIKEVWEVKPENWKEGFVSHTLGYPLNNGGVYGGGWMYHFGDGLVSIGLVTGLDYKNPWISPYQEFQRMKLHPFYKNVLKGGKCISYGARALNEGGWQSVPQLHFPGGVLVGASAGFMNVPKIKGSHCAIKSGSLAAECMFDKVVALKEQQEEEMAAMEEEANENVDEEGKNEEEEEEEDEDEDEDDEGAGLPLPEWKAINLEEYQTAYKNSWIYDELYEVRNVRPSFNTNMGVLGGMAMSGLVTMVTRGKEPFTLEFDHTDSSVVEDASNFKKIEYPKPDGEITFDLMTSVNRTGTFHRDGERCHLRVPNMDLEKHKEISWSKYKGVEQRFCPAGVYEYVGEGDDVEFKINSQNCIHCKTCDIKVPTQDINWTVPEGGDGPKYQMT